MQTTVDSGQFCRLASIPPDRLTHWMKSRAIVPVERGTGRQRHTFRLMDVLAVVVGRGLNKRGQGLSRLAGNVMDALMAVAEADLRRSVAKGKRLLAVVGDQPVRGFWSKAETEESPVLMAILRTRSAPVLLVDIGEVWERLLARLGELERQIKAPMEASA